MKTFKQKAMIMPTWESSGNSGGEGVTIRNQNKTITENGTYTADSGYTGLGTVTVDVESETGGGGGLTLLHRAEVTEPVSLIQVDPTEEWKNYNFIVVVPRMLKSNTDEWLCFKTFIGANTYNEYMGTTGNKPLPLYDIQHSSLGLRFNNGKVYAVSGYNVNEYDFSDLKQLKFHPYYAENTFVSGAIEIYGVML